jgi:hypothetical protein
MANDGQPEATPHVPRQEAWWEDAAAAQARLDEWDAKTSTIWGDKRCCALCGVGALGTMDFCQLRLQPPPQTEDGQLAPAPPAPLLNSLTGSASVSADGQWWQSKTCRGNTAFAKDHNVSFRHEYFQQLSRFLPSALSQLAFLSDSMNMEMTTCLASFYSTIVFLWPCNTGTTTQSHITNNSQALACPPPLRYISTTSFHKYI